MVNPAFWFLVILGGFILWLVLSFAFRFIGRIISGINDHTRDALDLEPEESEDNNTKENGGNENV